MTGAITIRLDGPDARDSACAQVRVAPKGHVVSIRAAKRSLDQNAKLHSIFSDMAKAGFEWAGKKRNADEIKFLMVSGHAIATGHPGELMLGVEGERLMLRQSTAAMPVAEMTSLIDYCEAFCSQKGIPLAP